MSGLPDAERDARDVVRALAGLVTQLGRLSPDDEDTRRLLLHQAIDTGAAAQRVAAYLRALRGPGDGDAVAVPPRLGAFREWAPPRGRLFGRPLPTPHAGEVPHSTRRADPGE